MQFSHQPVYDYGSGENLLVAELCLYQPELAHGRWRAILSDKPFSQLQTVPRLCEKEDGRWVALGPSPILRDAIVHPDLSDFAAEYLQAAMLVFDDIPTGRTLFVDFGSESDSDHKWTDYAMVYFHSGYGIEGPVVSDSYLDFLPGYRALERRGPALVPSFGLAHEDGQIRGNANWHISPNKVEFSYDIDDEVNCSLLLTSERNGDEWNHSTTILIVRANVGNVIDDLRFAGKSPEDQFKDHVIQNDLLFKKAFPALARGDTLPTNVEHREDNQILFHFAPGTLRG